MKIYFKRSINREKNNRIEFIFINFDFFDGNDLLVKMIQKKYKIEIGEKIDGMFYTILPLSYDDMKFELLWHEDMGNLAYCINNYENDIVKLEELLKYAVEEINKKINN